MFNKQLNTPRRSQYVPKMQQLEKFFKNNYSKKFMSKMNFITDIFQANLQMF